MPHKEREADLNFTCPLHGSGVEEWKKWNLANLYIYMYMYIRPYYIYLYIIYSVLLRNLFEIENRSVSCTYIVYILVMLQAKEVPIFQTSARH